MHSIFQLSNHQVTCYGLIAQLKPQIKNAHVFHINDYPATPNREKISDGDRVYPGDGVAPLDEIIGTLYRNGFRGAFSLELFNREYWKQDARKVASTGLEKMKQSIKQALDQLPRKGSDQDEDQGSI